MNLSVYVLVGYSGPLVDAILLCVLAFRGRWKHFPAFTCLVAFDLISTVANVGWGIGNGLNTYAITDSVSVGLQLAVVYELLRRVIPSTDKLAQRGRRLFLRISIIGFLIAIFASILFHPPALHGFILYQVRLDVFAGLVVCETVIAVMLAAQQVGLGWRNHLIAIAQGLSLWAFSLVFIEGVGLYFNLNHTLTTKIYYARSVLYLGTLCYWSVALWREEPVRKPISPAMRKYIVALHDQVTYDLGKTGH